MGLGLGGQGEGQSFTDRCDRLLYGLVGIYRRFTDTFEFYGYLRSLRVLLDVVFVFATNCAFPFPCLYADPAYSIALAIVHFNGTSTLSLHIICLKLS